MSVMYKDYEIIQGDSDSYLIDIKDENGLDIALIPGDSIYMTVKPNFDKTTPNTFQKVITTFTNGKALIPILSTDTEDLKATNYVYDIELNRTGGIRTTLLMGSYIVKAGVTNIE